MTTSGARGLGRVDGKVALITGAGSGLGREVALLLEREGAKVAVSDIELEKAKAVVAEIDGHAIALEADVTDEGEVEAAVAGALAEFGQLDIVHANAGIAPADRGTVPFEDVTGDSWDAVNDVNMRGVFFTVKHAARAMKSRGGGSIVVTSSSAAFNSYPNMAIYGASKGGVNALVRGAALDLGRYGIRVNAVCPAYGMSINFGLPGDERFLGRSWDEVGQWDPDLAPMPLKVKAPPTILDSAYPVLFLASDESRWMSGVCLPATDGGTLSRVAIPLPDGWTFEDQVQEVLRSVES